MIPDDNELPLFAGAVTGNAAGVAVFYCIESELGSQDVVIKRELLATAAYLTPVAVKREYRFSKLTVGMCGELNSPRFWKARHNQTMLDLSKALKEFSLPFYGSFPLLLGVLGLPIHSRVHHNLAG